MSSDNPYAAPTGNLPFEILQESPFAGANGGMWRKGPILVMHSMAQLPDRCIKSNQPAYGMTLKRKLSWHHPAVFLALLANLLLYIILAIALSKRATIYVGLSEEWFARRRNAMIVGWGLVLLSVVLISMGFANIERSDQAPWLILAGVVLFFFGALYGLIRARIVTPQRISDQYIWLKGVHPDILRDLPDWPYQP